MSKGWAIPATHLNDCSTWLGKLALKLAKLDLKVWVQESWSHHLSAVRWYVCRGDALFIQSFMTYGRSESWPRV